MRMHWKIPFPEIEKACPRNWEDRREALVVLEAENGKLVSCACKQTIQAEPSHGEEPGKGRTWTLGASLTGESAYNPHIGTTIPVLFGAM